MPYRGDICWVASSSSNQKHVEFGPREQSHSRGLSAGGNLCRNVGGNLLEEMMPSHKAFWVQFETVFGGISQCDEFTRDPPAPAMVKIGY